MYLLGKYYNSLIAMERKQLRLWKYFNFFHMTQFQFLVLYWNNFLWAKLSSSLIFFSLCPNCLLSFPQCWRVLNVGKNSPGSSAHPPLVSTPTYMSTPCRDDSEGDQAIIISHHHWFHEATIYQTISGRGNGSGGWVRVEVGEDWEMGVSVSGRTSHRILSPFPQTHKAICRC